VSKNVRQSVGIAMVALVYPLAKRGQDQSVCFLLGQREKPDLAEMDGSLRHVPEFFQA